MDKKTNEALQDLVAKATAGDKKALETAAEAASLGW